MVAVMQQPVPGPFAPQAGTPLPVAVSVGADVNPVQLLNWKPVIMPALLVPITAST